jgi:hypothetical protein
LKERRTAMCERCGRERKPFVIDGASLLTHYCFSPPPGVVKPFGFGWVVEQPVKQAEQEKQ